MSGPDQQEATHSDECVDAAFLGGYRAATRPSVNVDELADEIAQAIGLGFRNEYQGDVDDIREILRHLSTDTRGK